MDHDHYDWSPLNTTRAALTGRQCQSGSVRYRDLEHMEWSRPPAATSPISRWLCQGPFPDVTPGHIAILATVSGIFRVLDVLDRRGVKPTIAWMSYR